MLGIRDRRACEHWLLELANLPTPVSGGGETRTFLSLSLSLFLLFSLFLFLFFSLFLSLFLFLFLVLFPFLFLFLSHALVLVPLLDLLIVLVLLVFHFLVLFRLLPPHSRPVPKSGPFSKRICEEVESRLLASTTTLASK